VKDYNKLEMKKQELVQKNLGFDPLEKNYKNLQAEIAYAPVNFALIKYWGKDDEELMIPKTNSLSVSLGKNLGSTSQIEVSDKDVLIVNKKEIDSKDKKYLKVFDYLNLFRSQNLKLKITLNTTVPIAAGLASSAALFASLILTINKFFKWNLPNKKLSILARLGSGSAARSIYLNGFVEMKKNNGLQASAKQLKYEWPDLYLGIVLVSEKEKSISSRDGMKQTVENSMLYTYGWKKQISKDLYKLKNAIKIRDFPAFSTIVQRNALAMHATAISAGVIYWSEETLKMIQYVLELQKQNIPICFTIDAGPNLKIFTQDEEILKKYFEDAQVYKLF